MRLGAAGSLCSLRVRKGGGKRERVNILSHLLKAIYNRNSSGTEESRLSDLPHPLPTPSLVLDSEKTGLNLRILRVKDFFF